MKIIRIQDKYNSSKVWIIKVTNCYHYYINQEIKGRLFYRKFTKTTRIKLDDTGLWTMSKEV